ncbi:RNA polymerase sigma factor [Streptosporangium jomthongense]|uniref:RNA polymerase sigma factor n=1 Tax=Streptosporangium jomthongense TaxID=1193683 RepID=A0ABV8ETZ3_9ACTN
MNGETVAQATAPPGAGAVLADLYREHRLALVRLAVLLVGDRESAEDVVQDVFSRLHTAALNGGRPGTLTLTYVRVCVLNASRSLLRRRGVAARLRLTRRDWPIGPDSASGSGSGSGSGSAETSVLLGETRQEMLAALGRLPRRQREVLVLRYYLDLSDAEIAQVTRLGQSTVRSTVSRALGRLERELGGKA